jgi:hypothetical protein
LLTCLKPEIINTIFEEYSSYYHSNEAKRQAAVSAKERVRNATLARQSKRFSNRMSTGFTLSDLHQKMLEHEQAETILTEN